MMILFHPNSRVGRSNNLVHLRTKFLTYGIEVDFVENGHHVNGYHLFNIGCNGLDLMCGVGTSNIIINGIELDLSGGYLLKIIGVDEL